MEITPITYPAFFPCPTWSYAEQETSFLGRTAFESGWTRQRKRWQDKYTQLELSFRMDTVTYAKWQTWCNANGYAWFTIELDKFNGGKEVQIIRMTTDVSYTYASFDIISATVSAEIYGGKPDPAYITPVVQ